MVKGTWFDSFHYEGEDPDSEIDCDVCNGRVYSNEELELIVVELEQCESDLNLSNETKIFLDEIKFKIQAGIECNY